MPTFDLRTEPWIPVLDAATDLRETPDAAVRPALVGLREAVVRAHEIREVVGETPLETVALNRLLLALALDAHGFRGEPGPWWALWDAGRSDADALDGYFRQHAGRFDLLHPERPFFQVPIDSQPVRGSWALSKIRHAEASGENGTLFGHEIEDPPRPEGEPARRLPLEGATRAVLAYQAYGLGGAGATRKSGAKDYLKHAPLVSGAVFWLRGRSLFESLLLNAPPHRKVWIGVGDDAPAWRRDRPITGERPPEGLLDLLTWQARHVTLTTESDPEGAPFATAVFVANAEIIDAADVPDPMMATVTTDKKGTFPYGLRSERAVWRDLDTLLRALPDAEGRPPTFAGLSRLLDGHDGDRLAMAPDVPFEADVFGVENDKSKMLRWRHARVPVYPALLGDPNRIDRLDSALKDAEEQARSLGYAVRTVAEYLLSPPPPGSEDKPNADKKAVSALAASLGAERRFWAAAEPLFFAFLSRLAQADAPAERADLLLEWDRQIWDAAQVAFEAATSALDHSARHLRARAQGLRVLRPAERLQDHQRDESTPRP